MERRTFQAERARRESDPLLEKRLRALETYLEGTGIPVENGGSAGPGIGSQPELERIPESQVIFDEDGHDHSGGEQGNPIDHDDLENVLPDQHAHTVLSSAHTDTDPDTLVEGDILRANASDLLERLPIGAGGEVLTVVGGLPAWAPSSGGGSTGTGVVRVPFGAWAKGNLSLLSTTPGDELDQSWSKGANDTTPMIPSAAAHLTVIKVSCENAPTGADVTFTVYKNGVATALAVTLTAGNDTAVATGSVAFAAEDLITVFAYRSASISNSNHQAVAVVEGYYDDFTGGAPGVKEGGVAVVAAANQIDFGAGFDVTESPTGEANVNLDLSEAVTGDVSFTGNAGTVEALQGVLVPAPVAGDDGKALTYDHASGEFIYDSSGGGAPTDAQYLVGAASGSLSAEKVIGTDFLATATYASIPGSPLTGDIFIPTNWGDSGGSLTALERVGLHYNGSAWRQFSKSPYSPMLAQGRISASSTLAVPSADVTSTNTLYYLPFTGAGVAELFYGGYITSYIIPTAGVSLALSGLTSGKPYDVFLYTDSLINTATLALELVVWTNDTTRATALATNGLILHKSGDETRRYVGTIYTTNTNETVDTAVKRYVWNLDNQVLRHMRGIESTDAWNYTSTTMRRMNDSSSNRVDWVQGLALGPVTLMALGGARNTGANRDAWLGVGIDSDTTNSGLAPPQHLSTVYNEFHSYYQGFPGVGKHYGQPLERSEATGTTTWLGDLGQAGQLAAGIIGNLMG